VRVSHFGVAPIQWTVWSLRLPLIFLLLVPDLHVGSRDVKMSDGKILDFRVRKLDIPDQVSRGLEAAEETYLRVTIRRSPLVFSGFHEEKLLKVLPLNHFKLFRLAR